MNTTLIGLLSGLALAGGIILFVMSLQPPPEKVAKPTLRNRARGPLVERLGLAGPRGRRRIRNLIIGSMIGLVLVIMSGTFIFLPIFAVGAVILPELMSGGRQKDVVARSEALETWTRSMSGVLISGIGLEEAIRTSLSSTPPAIRVEMGRLVARLEAGQGIEPALRAWADEMNDATADLVAGALIMGSRTRKGGLSRALAELADAVAEQTRVVQQIEAERAGPRTTVQWVTIISLAIVGFVVLNPGFGDVYRAPMGQLVLATVFIGYLAVLTWMKKISDGKPLPRFLVDDSAPIPGGHAS